MSDNHKEVSPDLSQIEAYAKAKEVIARDLHFVREVLQERKSERRDAACRDLMAKLAEDHFTLAVLGQFKRGKSSLMNAIIGRPLLPTGVLPLTSAITVLRFGSRERLLIEHERSSVVSEVPLSSLSEYVTEKSNPGNRKSISRAIIETPSPFLRRGLEFVDTPGVGSAIEANTAITQSFLPKCDAVVFITGVDSPLSSNEAEFLAQIREHVRKVFFIANKTDLLGDGEREEVLRFISRNIQSIMDSKSVRIFPLSCQDGLNAKVEGDMDRYARSGVKSFEETLSGFLSTERMSVFLVSILDRTIRLIDEEICEIDIEARAASLSKGEVREIRTELQKRLEQIRSSREHEICSMRERLLSLAERLARREISAILQNEQETLRADILEAIRRQRWSLSYRVVRGLAREQLKHRNADLDRWAAEVWENLWPVFKESAQRELQMLLAQFREIPRIAAEVLKLETTPFVVSEEFGEIEVASNSRALNPRKQERQQISLPAFSLFPALVVRRSLARHCERELQRTLETAKVAICDAIIAVAEDRLDNTISRVEKMARSVEERVESAVAGRAASSSDSSAGESLAKQCDRLTELRTRSVALRDRLMESQSSGVDVTAVPPISFEVEAPTETGPAPEPAPVRDTGGVSFDLTTRGCPACNRVHKAMFDFFSHLQYELSGSEASQSNFAAEGGLCRLHTWQLEEVASPQGLSHGYPQLVSSISRKLARLAADDGNPAKSVLSLVQNSAQCPACEYLRTTEAKCLERFAKSIQTPQGADTYARSQGLCLRHLALLLELGLPEDTNRYLLNHASAVLNATAEDMQSYALKHDALRRELHNQDEEDAYKRALIRLAGARYLAAPDAGEE